MDHSVLDECNEIDTAISCIDYAPHAHKHIPLFLKLDIYDINDNNDNQNNHNHYNEDNNINNESSLFNMQVITNGKDLTSFKIRNGDISLQHPIIVKDTPQSIGMRVSIEQLLNNGKKSTSPSNKKASTSNNNKKRRKRNKNDDEDDDDDYDNTSSNMNINSSTRTCNIIRTIGNIVGPAAEVSMIDVRTQQLLPGDYTFGQLCDYFDDEKRLMIIGRHHHIQQEKEKEDQLQNNNNSTSTSTSRRMPRRKVTTKYDMNGIMDLQILNQVSYEFSRSKLSQYVSSPQFVREIDWIDIVWPSNLRYDESAGHYPAVQYYCLTSCAGSYMDYHIDFGGSSVWYHIVSGRKEFCLIIPTSENLIQYENWLCNPKQNDIFLPDNIYDKNTIRRIILYENQTMIIPSGYIHSVYTPIDSIVFGGNYLHGYDIEMQNKIYDIETRRKVLDKYLFPYYIESNIYASHFYYKKMISGEISIRELNQLSFLLNALNKWIIIDNNDDNDNDNNDNAVTHDNSTSNTDIPTKYKAIQYVLKEHQLTSFTTYLEKLRQEIKRNEIDGISRSNDNHMMIMTPTTASSSLIDPSKTTTTTLIQSSLETKTSKVTAPQKTLLQHATAVNKEHLMIQKKEGVMTEQPLFKLSQQQGKDSTQHNNNNKRKMITSTSIQNNNTKKGKTNTITTVSTLNKEGENDASKTTTKQVSTKKTSTSSTKATIKVHSKGPITVQNDNKSIGTTKKAAATVEQKKGIVIAANSEDTTVTKSNDNDPDITSSKNDVVLIQNTVSNNVDTNSEVLPKKSSSRIVIKRKKNDDVRINKEIKLSSSFKDNDDDDDVTPTDKKTITLNVTKSNSHNTVTNEEEQLICMQDDQDQSKTDNDYVPSVNPSSLEETGQSVDGKSFSSQKDDPHENIEGDHNGDQLKEPSSMIPNAAKNRKIRIKVSGATEPLQMNDNVNSNESSVKPNVPLTSTSSSVPEDPVQPPTNPNSTTRQKKNKTATVDDSVKVKVKQDQAEAALATSESTDTLNKSDDIEDDDDIKDEDDNIPKFRVESLGDTQGVRRSGRRVTRRDWSDLGRNNTMDDDDEEFIDTSSGNNKKKKMKTEVAALLIESSTKKVSTTNKQQESQLPKGTKKKKDIFVATILRKPSKRISTSRQRLKMKTDKKFR